MRDNHIGDRELSSDHHGGDSIRGGEASLNDGAASSRESDAPLFDVLRRRAIVPHAADRHMDGVFNGDVWSVMVHPFV